MFLLATIALFAATAHHPTPAQMEDLSEFVYEDCESEDLVYEEESDALESEALDSQEIVFDEEVDSDQEVAFEED